MMQWLNMGGFWQFVWPCYILTAVVVGLNIYFARRSLIDAKNAARRRVQSQGASR